MTAFKIENMNFFDNLISQRTILLEECIEELRMSISSIGEYCLLKFHQFMADFFLICEKRINLWKNFVKRIRGKTPNSSSFFPYFFRNKANVTTESFNKPRHYWKFSISDFKTNCINMIRFIFRKPVLNSKTSFSINEACKISKISRSRNNNVFSRVKGFYILFIDKIMHMPIFLNLFNNFFSFLKYFRINFFSTIPNNCRRKFDKEFTRYFFIYEHIRNKVSQFGSFLSFYCPLIRNFMIGSLCFFSNRSSKSIHKFIQNIWFNRDYLYVVFINDYFRKLLEKFSEMKTPVPINISSTISKINFVFHVSYFTDKLNLSQDPQRLTGREELKSSYVIVRTTSKDLEGGITRLPALINKVIKVTDSRQTEDQLMRDMLASTASFVNCVGGGNGDNPTEITRGDIDLIVRTLRGNNAYSFLSGVDGENRFGTAPVRDAYFALGHTDLIGQIDNCNGFIQKWNYPQQSSTLDAEWGSVANLRFLLSSIGSTTANASLLGSTVYNVFCAGRESFAAIEQDGYSSQFIYRPPIYDGPLALNASVGYKFAEVPRLLNDTWVFNLRCTLA